MGWKKKKNLIFASLKDIEFLNFIIQRFNLGQLGYILNQFIKLVMKRLAWPKGIVNLTLNDGMKKKKDLKIKKFINKKRKDNVLL